MSTIGNMAEAVAGLLGAHQTSRYEGFEITTAYVPLWEVRDLRTPRITVVPKSVTVARVDRTRMQYDVAIDIAVQGYMDDKSVDALDHWMECAEYVLDTILDYPTLTHMVSRHNEQTLATLWEVQSEPLFSPEHVQELSVFTSVVTATYRYVA